MTSPAPQRSASRASRRLAAWLAALLMVGGVTVGVWVTRARLSPPRPQPSSAGLPPASASCADPAEPGCSQCLSHLNPDGTPFVLEGGAEGYTSGRSLPDLPGALRPCARCRKEHRLMLEALSRVTTCQEVHVDDAGTPTYGESVSTEGYCSRYRSAEDYGMDPSFHAGSCERHCWQLFVAREHCPP